MNNRLRHFVAGSALSLLIAFGVAESSAQWKDSSSHKVQFIEVQPGVRLEVLDWGGTGAPILLLAGHGDTAHVFDDFAPKLTDHFHVYALTRRGFGASSQPAQGYDLKTLVNDIAQVTRALKLQKVNLVGHSIAGDEMTRFAQTFPEMTGKLVYLEAAYDRVDAQHVESNFPRLSSSPPAPQDLQSAAAMQAYTARTEIAMPEAEIRATNVFGADGRYVRPVTPDGIVHSVAVMVEHPNYRAIQKPLMAIYTVYETPAQFSPRYATADPETQKALTEIFTMWTNFAQTQRQLLHDQVPDARIVTIPGASHYVFLSNPAQVLKAIEDFLN